MQPEGMKSNFDLPKEAGGKDRMKYDKRMSMSLSKISSFEAKKEEQQQHNKPTEVESEPEPEPEPEGPKYDYSKVFELKII